MDIAGLPERLAALDAERLRRSAQGGTAAYLDVAPAREMIESLREMLPVGPAGEPPAAIAEREAALNALKAEFDRRLQAKDAPDLLALGLRRLEEAVFRPCSFGIPADASAALAHGLRRIDEALTELQGKARDLLEAELALVMMPDQTGRRIDPKRHNVVGSRPVDDPSLDDTVVSQQRSGWLIGEEVLARADVTRYASPTGRTPAFPDLDDVDDGGLDDAMMGKKR